MGKNPWEIDSRLKEERLISIANILDGVRTGVADHLDPDQGDRFFGGWVAGTTAYARSAAAIAAAADSGILPWLSVVDRSMQFTFAIEGVPVRVYHGDASEPSRSAVKGSPVEQQAQMVAFDLDAFTDERLNWGWRIAVETDPEGRAFEMTFVQVHRSGATRYPYSIPFRAARVSLAPVASFAPAPVDLPPVIVEPLVIREESGTGPGTLNTSEVRGSDDREG
jgi:hypothetical protein